MCVGCNPGADLQGVLAKRVKPTQFFGKSEKTLFLVDKTGISNDHTNIFISKNHKNVADKSGFGQNS